MTRYLIGRVAWAAVLLLAATLVTYAIFFLVPANPAVELCGKVCTPEDLARVEAYWGLDRPVPVQYARFLERLVVDRSLGVSFATRRDVNDIVAEAAPVTASLVLGGAVMWMLIAVPLGILSALRPRTFLDRAAMVLVVAGISVHPVWIGLILSYLLGFKLGWFPLTGYCDAIGPSAGCGGLLDWAHHLVLPWLTFAILFAALYARMIRASVLETLHEDYVRTARAKGVPEAAVMRSHVLRNAMLPLVTMLGLDIGLALGGAVFTETVFGLPGLGKTAITALQAFDLPTIQGIVVFSTVCIIALNLLVDVLYAVIDPRIRLARAP